MNNISKNKKAGFFILGVLAVTAGVKFIIKTYKHGCVKIIAED